MVGRWDSGTEGKYMIWVLFCPKYLGQWDGGTQEKHVQFGCQSILVLHSFCPQMVGQQENMICGLLCPKYLGQWNSGTQEKTFTVRLSVYTCET